MEESLVCPICETENAPDSTHCEVCGERLVPAEPGEDVGPEESVAEQLTADGGEVVGFAVEDDDEAAADATAEGLPISEYESEGESEVPPAAAAAGDEMSPEDLEAEFEALEAEEGGEFDEEPPEVPGAPADDTDEAVMAAPADETVDIETADLAEQSAEPEFLYSPDGTAYPKGSPEYEEGFGPMGEELVAEPPEDVEIQEAAPSAPSEDSEDAGAGFEDEYDDEYDELDEADYDETDYDTGDETSAAAAAPAEREPSAEFKAAFQAREKQRPSMEPLPEPGTYVEPATITVYVNREPVLRHEIETDETLIGRKDPIADAYPDIDLSDYDPEAHVSRKHAYIYRQNKNYTLYAVSNAGTQVNDKLLDLGDRERLSDGDVIVLAGKIAMKFDLPGA